MLCAVFVPQVVRAIAIFPSRPVWLWKILVRRISARTCPSLIPQSAPQRLHFSSERPRLWVTERRFSHNSLSSMLCRRSIKSV